MQDAIDVIEDGYLVRSALVRVCSHLLQGFVVLAVEVHPACLVEVLLVGVDIEGEGCSTASIEKISSRK